MNIVEESLGEGRLSIHATAVHCGNDCSITITGGTLPHIGAVSLGVYEPERSSATVSTITVYSHRDDVCATSCARLAASYLRCNVCVSVGIHIDEPDDSELRALVDNCMECCKALIRRL